MLTIIDTTTNLSLDLSDKGNYIIHMNYSIGGEPVAIINKDLFKIVDKNLQNCITTWDLYCQFIKLVDEAFDLIEENK